jgi:Domain of unknown function (DUF1840)
MALLFRSKAGADVLMLQADAERVLRALGREPAAQGVFLPEQVDGLLQQFSLHAKTQAAQPDESETPDEAAPDLTRRAWPLLELMRASRARGVPLTWSPA